MLNVRPHRDTGSTVIRLILYPLQFMLLATGKRKRSGSFEASKVT